MALSLRVMTNDDLDEFGGRLRASLLADLIESGFGEPQAAVIADGQLTAAFADGEATPGHHLCWVMDDDRVVGHAWFGPDPMATGGGWWLYELEIDAANRGRGIGTAAVDLLEAEVSRLGGSAIGLRVFDHNTGARRLYDQLGYRAVSTLMRKVL